jgi:hypothetical protein
VIATFRRIAHELGNGRAVLNARIERDEMALMYARVDMLERRYEGIARTTATATTARVA